MTDEAHDSSVAVWDIPSPAVMSRPFTVKVGIACPAGCALDAHEIEVRDGTGTSLARARLSATPWPGTTALYWTEVELCAAGSEGQHTWYVVPGPDAACGSDGSDVASGLDVASGSDVASGLDVASGFSRKNHAFSTSFTFTVARPPEHIVTITAVDSTVHAPAGRVEIRLGPYRATTDEEGRATIPMPSGSYDAIAWKVGYEADPVTVAVTGDVALRIDLRPVAGTDEQYWM